MDIKSRQYNRYRKQLYIDIGFSRDLFLHSNECFGLYLISISRCNCSRTTDFTDCTNSRHHHTADLRNINRKCSIEWITINRYMDLDQNSGWNDNNRYRNKLYCIITFSRNVYLYCDKFFRLYLFGFSQYCY